MEEVDLLVNFRLSLLSGYLNTLASREGLLGPRIPASGARFSAAAESEGGEKRTGCQDG